MLKQILCLCALVVCSTSVYAETNDVDNQKSFILNSEVDSEDESILSCDRCRNILIACDNDGDANDDEGTFAMNEDDNDADELFACDGDEGSADADEPTLALNDDDQDGAEGSELFAFEDEVDQQSLAADDEAFAQGDDDNLFYAVDDEDKLLA